MKKCLHEKTEWFEKNMNSLGKLSSYDDPSVLASQIHSQREVRLWRFLKIFLVLNFF